MIDRRSTGQAGRHHSTARACESSVGGRGLGPHRDGALQTSLFIRDYIDKHANETSVIGDFPIDLSISALHRRGAANAAITSEIFRLLVRCLFEVLVGLTLDSDSRKTIPVCEREMGIFGTPVSMHMVVETSGRQALHGHAGIIAGPSATLLVLMDIKFPDDSCPYRQFEAQPPLRASCHMSYFFNATIAVLCGTLIGTMLFLSIASTKRNLFFVIKKDEAEIKKQKEKERLVKLAASTFRNAPAATSGSGGRAAAALLLNANPAAV